MLSHNVPCMYSGLVGDPGVQVDTLKHVEQLWNALLWAEEFALGDEDF